MTAGADAFKADLVAILPRLRRFGRMLTGSADEGDELVQAACERAIARYRDWTPGSRLDSWMFTIMRNLWVSELRKRKVRTGQGVVSAEAQTEASTEPRAETLVHLRHVYQAIQALPEGQRTALLLVGVEGYSYKEAAEILDVPLGTITSQLARGRLALGERFKDTDEAPRPAETRKTS